MSGLKSKSEESIKKNTVSSTPYQHALAQKVNNDIYEDGTIDPVYQAKARVLNAAIQEIGMGRYQVCFTPHMGGNVIQAVLNDSGIFSSSQVSAGLRTFQSSMQIQHRC